MSRLLVAAVLVVGVAVASLAGWSRPVAAEEGGVHWDYGDEEGPERWHELQPDWAICGTGQQQSPIDLGLRTGEVRIPVRFDYVAAELRIARTAHVVDVINNGHTIQVDYDAGSTITAEGVTYDLAQYHFHAPSEHTVNGNHYPMEMHLVHQSSDGRLLVLGIFIGEGEHNAAFEPVWAHLPDDVGEQKHLEDVQVNIDNLFPEDRSTVRYMGSLTTPPCSEGVSWLVAVEPVELSAEQIAAFTRIVSDNARPVQERHGRPVHSVLPPMDDPPPSTE